MIFTIIGYLGLALLMLAVVFDQKKQRIVWMTSSFLLTIFSIYTKNNIFILVNSWATLVNLYYLIKQNKPKPQSQEQQTSSE